MKTKEVKTILDIWIYEWRKEKLVSLRSSQIIEKNIIKALVVALIETTDNYNILYDDHFLYCNVERIIGQVIINIVNELKTKHVSYVVKWWYTLENYNHRDMPVVLYIGPYICPYTYKDIYMQICRHMGINIVGFNSIILVIRALIITINIWNMFSYVEI